MNKLEFIDDLIAMVRTDELKHPCGKEDSEWILLEIRRMYMESLDNEVLDDITDKNLSFYAPDFENWKDYLNFFNGYEDYAEILESYTEKDLGALWEASHLTGYMDEEHMRRKLFRLISTLKMLDTLTVKHPVALDKAEIVSQRKEVIAQIKGIYNMLYED